MAAFTPALAEVDEANFGARGRQKSSLELKGLSGAWVQELCGVTGHTTFHL